MNKLVIQFVCAGGMSSSLVVSKMQKAAEEKNIDIEIWATGVQEGKEIITERKDIDVLLLAPQVRYMEKNLREFLKDKKTILQLVEMRDYGFLDGEKILSDILRELNIK